MHLNIIVVSAPKARGSTKYYRANGGKQWRDTTCLQTLVYLTILWRKTSFSKPRHIFLERLVMLIIFNNSTFSGLKEKCFNFVFVLTSIQWLYITKSTYNLLKRQMVLFKEWKLFNFLIKLELLINSLIFKLLPFYRWPPCLTIRMKVFPLTMEVFSLAGAFITAFPGFGWAFTGKLFEGPAD